MAGKRYKYDFAKKKHSSKGVVSSIFAGISLGSFCIAAVASLIFHGKGGMYLGALGFIAMGLSIYGFILGLKSFSEKNRDQLFCKIGAAGNGVLMVIWLGLFLAGLA